jgi:hypothetical protein
VKEKEIMPAAIESLINNLLDTNFNVWQRQPYRERLERMRNQIDECIRKFDMEYAKAHKTNLYAKAHKKRA